MSRTQTPDDLFKLLKQYEDRIDRLERANATPQSAPLIFQGEGMAPDSRLRRTAAGVFVVEKTTDGGATWTQTWSTQATDSQSTGWQNPSIQAPFAPYANGYNTPSYHKDSTGRVHLRGLLNLTGANGGGATIFTLPFGFRPESRVLFDTQGSAALARVDVETNGVVSGQTAIAAGGWLSLDGLSFMSSGGPYSGQSTPNMSYVPDSIVYPGTPWWSGGAVGGIVNNGADQEVVSASGQTSRIVLPTYPFQTAWECSLDILVSADSGNWTKILAGIHLFSGAGVLQDFKWFQPGASNKGATSNGDYDWTTAQPRIRITLPANSVGWFFRPTVTCPTQYGGAYYRGYEYSDFWTRRIM